MDAGSTRQPAGTEEPQETKIWAETNVCNVHALRPVSQPRDPDGQADCVSCIHIGEPVPAEVKQHVAEVRKSSWMVSNSARYRKCRALHFGLSINRFKKQTWFGKASERLPDLQRLIISHVKKIHPTICFSSFILNMYVAGNLMGRHDDRNLVGHSMQVVFIWGDYQGGDLVVYRHDGSPVRVAKGPVSLLMDGNVQHEVTAVTRGTRYSIITYAKETFAACPAEVRHSLIQMGFPLPDVGLHCIPSQAVGPQALPGSQWGPGQAEHASHCAQLLGWFDKMCEDDLQTIHTNIQDCEILAGCAPSGLPVTSVTCRFPLHMVAHTHIDAISV